LAAAARAEEEAALNMAILLSLRDNRPVATAAGGEQPTAANPTVPATEAAAAAAPAEADIAQLEGMGFPRADAVAALQATGNDVARAADRLLGAG
jgi:NACalpha-BTF3-like transcription factor